MALAFLSGAAALIYQTAWARAFIPLFGLTVYAGAAVIFTFLLGLTLGSWAAGLRSPLTGRNPWRVYAVIELGIALTGGLLPRLLPHLTSWYAAMHDPAGSRVFGFLLRLAVCGAVILIPTMLMGMTLPAIARAMSRPRNERGGLIANLYAINALGGAFGAAFSIFFLLRDWGTVAAGGFAAAINAAAGLAALALARGAAPSPAAEEPRSRPLPGGASWSLLIYGVIGFCTFSFEMLWLRLLVIYLQATVYSLGLMLICCLAGIALGSWSWRGGLRRLALGAAAPGADNYRRAFAVLALLLGLVNILGLRFYGRTAQTLLGLARLFGIETWRAVTFEQFVAAALILLPGFFVSGMIFPLLSEERTLAGGDEARAMSHAYAASTAGGFLGTLLTPFVILGALGVQGAFQLTCLLCAVCGVLLFASAAGGARRRRIEWTALLAAFALLYVSTSKDLVRKNFEDAEGKLLFYRETPSDVAMVVMRTMGSIVRPVPFLAFGDGRGTCAEYGPNNYFNRLMAYSSMAVNPAARRVLVISMGCGHTAAAFAAFPIERLDIVDISPNAFAAARFFTANNGVLADPRVHIHVEDGRNFLLLSPEKYDVIQLELPSLHTDGVVFLYTDEFYRLARSRLNVGGVLSQWVDSSQAGPEILRVLLHTALLTFRRATLWSDWPWWFTLTDDARSGIDYQKVTALFRDPKVVADMRSVGSDLEDVLSAAVASGDALDRGVDGRHAVTDDRTWVDYAVLESRRPGGFFNGLSYYTSPLATAFSTRLRAGDTFGTKAEIASAFYGKASFAAPVRRSLELLLDGFPAAVRERIIAKALKKMSLRI